jgi:hypothetical protein
MTIPTYVTITFCKTCEHQITENRLCLHGCKWDGNMTRDRPVIIRVYWLRDDPRPRD